MHHQLCGFWHRALLVALLVAFSSCDTVERLTLESPVCSPLLSKDDVEAVIAHAVEQAQRLNQKIIVAVSDREGNVLGVFRMTGARLDTSYVQVCGLGNVAVTQIDTAIRKARTAAFLSSNGHAFSTLTACFITRSHFPPGVANAPAGPLFGVGLSSLPGGDIMPNGNALNDRPGGIPIYKGGCLAGGIGVVGASSQFDPTLCAGQSLDEVIALGAVIGMSVPSDKRGDNIFIDGIRFLYANAAPPPANFTLTFANALTLGSVEPSFQTRAAPPQRFPDEGVVMLGGGFDFPIRAGSLLSLTEVDGIIKRAAAQAARTRAAIRRPVGASAQVFIAVVDLDGSVLGVWRTPDATIFSFDVAVQKARTALVFSNPENPNAPNNIEFSARIRSILGMSPAAPLAITTRAVGFLAQDFFPPGIDRDSLGRRTSAGPLFEGTNFSYQFRLLAQGLPTFGPCKSNGITIFPGGIPLYKNGQLVGAIGVSGDGVDQDDLIASAGAKGLEPPVNIRCDQFFYDGVRLPYIKTPRQPEIR
jgi:uncharacterized protein GlcG (DUF336 family)